MSEIPASVVMTLRNRTGLSMMECKKAIVEAGGDLGKAEELLRKKLKGKMDARTDRAAGEGRIAVAIHTGPDAGGAHPHAAIVELRAETDFTAKNEQFIAAAQRAAELAAESPAGRVAGQGAISATLDQVRITTGENCSFARGEKLLGNAASVFGAYVHHDGKKGVLIQAEGVNAETLRDIGMHIVAMVPAPKGISPADIPQSVVDKERAFRLEEAIESGKPKEIAEKMVERAIRKFFEDIALLEQPYVKNPSKKVKDIVGAGGKIITFKHWLVGEATE